MIRPLIFRIGLGAGLLWTLTACAGSPPAAREPVEQPPIPASTQLLPKPTASAAPVATNTGQTPGVQVFTVDGAGPYLIGVDFSQLKTKGQLAEATTSNAVCGAHLDARGTTPWQDIRVAARTADSKVYLVVNRSSSIPTPHGAKLGMTVLQLKAIYGSSGEELTKEGNKAYLVKTSTANGVLFTVADGKVSSMIAGNSTYLRQSFLAGDGYC